MPNIWQSILRYLLEWRIMCSYLVKQINWKACYTQLWAMTLIWRKSMKKSKSQSRDATAAENNRVHLWWKNVVLQFLSGTCCTSPKNVNVQRAMFPVPTLSAGPAGELYMPNVLTELFFLHILFCSELWVTSNTFKHPYLFSSGSKNMVEKVNMICTIFLVWWSIFK